MRTRALGTLGVLLILSACAAGGGGSPDASAPPSQAPSIPLPSSGDGDGIEHPAGDEAVLTVSSQGGFVPLEFTATAMPSFVMLGDGRVIVQGAVPAIFPGPALPALQERTLTAEGIQTVLEAVEDSGLFTQDLELRGAQAMVADAPDTVFHLNAAGREVTIVVYALGMIGPDMDPPPGMSSAEVEAHEVLTALNDALLTIDTSVPADQWEADGWRPYEASALRLYVRDVTGEPIDEGIPEDVREWPLADADPGTMGEEVALFANGTRCAALEGEAAATWWADLGEASQVTRWTTDGTDRWSVMVRPLLPYEEVACPQPVG
jgi:hypothetical protein